VTTVVVIVRIARQGDGAATRTVTVVRGVSGTAPEGSRPLDVSARPTVTSTPTTAPVVGATGILSAAAVRRYLAGRKGNVTAAIYDIATGSTSVWRPGVVQYAASIVKVEILATLLDQFEDQGHPLSSREASLAARMIEQSDNTATDALWTEAGGEGGVAGFGRSLGLAATIPGTGLRWGYTKTTAADQVTLLKALVLQESVLQTAARNYALGLMQHVDKDDAWGISAGVGRGIEVALKNGWLSVDDDAWQVNSIGWVNGQDRNYVVAILTDSDPTEGYGIQTIQGLSSLIWANSSH
jgi:beta-lactamase class A